jgi:uncharacterized membrane protein YdjX (TVP38/TMEM64 family)
LFIVGSILVLQRLDLGRALSIENMRTLLDSYAPYGPLVFMGIIVGGFYLRLPQFMIITVGGMLFEPTHAFVYCWIATVVGTASTFLLVRWFAREAFQRLLITRFRGLQALDARLERHGFVTVLGLRLVLFLSSPLNWAIGATRVRVPHYIGGTALGIVPGIAGLVFFADSIATHGLTATLLHPTTLLVAVLIVIFLVGAALVGRRLVGKGAGAPPR